MDPTLHYITVVAHRIQALRRQINLLGHSDFPSKSPQVLVEVLNRILMRLFDELLGSAQKTTAYSEEDILRKVQTINYAVVALGKYVEAIECAQVTTPMFSLVEAFENIGDRVSYGTQTIIYPQWRYNASYSDVMVQLREWVPKIDPEVDLGVFQALPAHLVVITYPAIEELNVLRQAILAHEMGHFVGAVLGISDEINNSQLYEPDIMVQIFALERKLSSKSLRQTAVKVVESWVQELMADLIGVSILGPAYIFSFDDVVRMPLSPASQSFLGSHPPYDLRIKFMVNLTNELHLDPLLPQLGSDFFLKEEESVYLVAREWLDNLIKTPSTQSDSADPVISDGDRLIILLAQKALDKAASLLTNRLKSLVSEGWLCTQTDVVNALKLQKALVHGLPPSELSLSQQGHPTFAAIMNSGWFYLISQESKYFYMDPSGSRNPEPIAVFDRYLKLQNLVAKAVENALFRMEYLRRKG